MGRAVALFFGGPLGTVVAAVAADELTALGGPTLTAVAAVGAVGSLATAARMLLRADQQHRPPRGMLLHGHAAAAYTTIVDGPARLRELDASEHAVGRVEELVPVAEHLAGVLAELRTELAAAGDPAGDTTGTPRARAAPHPRRRGHRPDRAGPGHPAGGRRADG